MKRWIERALNVRPGDLGRGLLLCSCLFLVICSYKIGGVAGGAPFLSRFQGKQLAHPQISSAVLVPAVLAGDLPISPRAPFPRLPVRIIAFFSLILYVY